MGQFVHGSGSGRVNPMFTQSMDVYEFIAGSCKITSSMPVDARFHKTYLLSG